MEDKRPQSQSLLGGAAVLMMTTVLVHLINIFYKIPITYLIGEIGRGYFTTAYELYTPIYAISMAGLPVAVSKMISERMAAGKYKEVRKIRDAARRAFLVTGILGTAIMLLLARPFTEGIVGSPKAYWSVLAIAPSIFVCCIMSTYRGYYEGLRNMTVTGNSQVVESISKLMFGVVLAQFVLKKGLDQWHATGMAFGVPCENKVDVINAAAPYSAAAAIGGVTIGTILALLYCFIIYHAKGDGISEEDLLGSPEPDEVGSLVKILVRTVIPIATSALVLNITNFIDTSTVQSRLKFAVAAGEDTIRNMYPVINQLDIQTEDIKDFLYGCYGVALDFRNLIPTVIMALGVSAIPVLAASYSTKDQAGMQNAIRTVVKTATVLAVPAGFAMAAISKPMLKVLYPQSLSTGISAPFVAIFGISALFLAISTPLNNMLQAVGRADVPVKSLLIGATAKIICNFVLVSNPQINIKGAPVGTVLCYVIIVANNMLVLLKVTGCKLNWFDCILRPIFVGALAGGAGFLVVYLSTPYLAPVLVCTLSLIVTFLIWLYSLMIFKVVTKSYILSLPKGKKIAKVLEKLRVLG